MNSPREDVVVEVTSWSLLTPLVEDLRARVSAFAPEVAARIRIEVPAYRDVRSEEHVRAVEGQLRAILDGLVEHRRPSPVDIEQARQLGTRRADLGVPLQDVVDAYHIAYPAIWRELEARATTAEQQRSLLAEVEFIWHWLHVLSAAVADAHVLETANRLTRRVALFRQLSQALEGHPIEEAAGAAVLEQLGFDPAGSFVALRAEGRTAADAEAMEVLLHTDQGTCRSALLDDAVLALVQGCDAEAVADLLRDRWPEAAVGVGMRRWGVVGVAASLQDASDAWSWSVRVNRVVRFETEWISSVLSRHGERVQPCLDAASQLATDRPHLAEAVWAFAKTGFSITASARALQVHPNSAKYRLDRWCQLTGWDPLTFNGLEKSIAALRACGFDE